MQRFKWAPTFEIGVEEIDNDHRHLVALAQQVSEAAEKGEGETCRSLVEGFVAALQSHIANEERLLAGIRYEDFATHKRYHELLLAKTRELKKTCDEAIKRGEAAACYLEVVGFVIDDMLRGDMTLKSYFDHRGLANRK